MGQTMFLHLYFILNQKNSTKAGWEKNIFKSFTKRACGILVQFNPPSVMQINVLTERGPELDSGTYKRSINLSTMHLCHLLPPGKNDFL